MSDGVRSKSRSPLPRRAHRRLKCTESYSTLQGSKPADCNFLRLRNIPNTWRFSDVQDVISEKSPEVANSILFIQMLKVREEGECIILFESYHLCAWAWSQLDGQLECDGKSIDIQMDKESSLPRKVKNKLIKHMLNSCKNTESPHQVLSVPAKWDDSSNYETYGLSTSYLNALAIKPPLQNRIYIGNIDKEVDDAKLTEVFSLAGNIVLLRMVKKEKAIIIYEHPVEAVQAISMFHDQPLYEKRLIVNMDKKPIRTKLLPRGLPNIGPGLAQNGEPLRNVRFSLELQPLKQLLTREIDKLNNEGANKSNPGTSGALNTNYSMNAQNDSLPNFFSQTNPFVRGTTNLSANDRMTSLASLVNPEASKNLQAMQSVTQQNQMGPLPQISHNVMGQNMLGQQIMGQNLIGQHVVGQNIFGEHVTGTMVGFDQKNQPNHGMLNQVDQTWSVNQSQSVKSCGTSYNSMKSGSGFGVGITSDREFNDGNRQITKDNYNKKAEHTNKSLMTSSDLLVFSKLPPSVTLSALTTKLQEVGELKYVDMAGQGRAIVCFKKMEDALLCIKIFNRSKVDGQMIDVSFF